MCAGCGWNELREQSADAVEAHEGCLCCSSTRVVQPAKPWGVKWVDSAFFCKKTWTFSHCPQLLACCAHYFMDMLNRSEKRNVQHRSFDVFEKAMMCSCERSKRVTLLHLRNVITKEHIYLSPTKAHCGEGRIFSSQNFPKVRIWHPSRTMQQLKPHQPIMVSKDEVSFGNVSSTWSTQPVGLYSKGVEEFQVPWINWNQGLQVELARRSIRKAGAPVMLSWLMVAGEGS